MIEAREAVKQAHMTLKQGRSIVIFTVVTVVFLPLSFCTSLFGMEAIEFSTDARLPLATELRIMLPVSVGVILVSFALAFSRGFLANSAVALTRSATSFAWNTAATWVAVKTGLYRLGRDMIAQAYRLRKREGTVTGTMKAEVLREEKNLRKIPAAQYLKELVKRRRLTGWTTNYRSGPVDSDNGQAAKTTTAGLWPNQIPNNSSIHSYASPV